MCGPHGREGSTEGEDNLEAISPLRLGAAESPLPDHQASPRACAAAWLVRCWHLS
jgi:hypothetical protein